MKTDIVEVNSVLSVLSPEIAARASGSPMKPTEIGSNKEAWCPA